MRKVVFLVPTLDRCARTMGMPFRPLNAKILKTLAQENNLDVTVVVAVNDDRYFGSEGKLKIAHTRLERDRVVAEINAADPELIFCFGAKAAYSAFDKGNVVLYELARSGHEIEGIKGKVFVLDSLSRAGAQPDIVKWMRLDLQAALNGFHGTQWGDYTTLLPGTLDWEVGPREGHGDMIGFDLETYPAFSPWDKDARIRMAIISYEVGKSYVIQIDPVTQEFPEWLISVLADPRVIKAGSYIAFDYKWCRRFGYNVVNMWDTSVAEHIINENNPKKGLKDLTFKYLPRLGHYSLAHHILQKKRGGWEFVGDDEQYQYAGGDGEASLAAGLAQRGLIRTEGLHAPHRIARDMYPILARMSEVGMCFDMKLNAEIDGVFQAKLAECSEAICEVLGPINPASTTQLADALFKAVKGINLKKSTFLRHWGGDGDERDPESDISTAKAVLEREAAKHPVLAAVLEFRRWNKLYGTYVSGAREKHAKLHGGQYFVHPRFRQDVTDTNRLSSAEPNAQNIPQKPGEGEDKALNVKRQFISRFGDDGCILEADFGQVEVRVAAWLSKDPNLCSAIAEKDMHVATASLMMRVPVEEVTKDMRQHAKTVGFATMYGAGANTVGGQLGIHKDEAKVLMGMYFAQFPVLREFIDNVHDTAKNELEIISPFGFRRRFTAPEPSRTEMRKVEEDRQPDWNCYDAWRIFRQAFNFLIQNTAAGVMYCALIDIDNRMRAAGMKSLLISTVHDSVIFDVYPGELKALATLVKDAMENPNTEPYGVHIDVPITVDLEVGKSWGDKKEYIL